jgi:hypothetical protein
MNNLLNSNSIKEEVIPLKFYLSQNYPNPFKDKTIIKFCVAYKTKIQMTILNLEGEEIAKLVDEEKKPGTYKVEFDGCVLQIGTYLCQLRAGNYKSEKRMDLIKKNNKSVH